MTYTKSAVRDLYHNKITLKIGHVYDNCRFKNKL